MKRYTSLKLCAVAGLTLLTPAIFAMKTTRGLTPELAREEAITAGMLLNACELAVKTGKEHHLWDQDERNAELKIARAKYASTRRMLRIMGLKPEQAPAEEAPVQGIVKLATLRVEAQKPAPAQDDDEVIDGMAGCKEIKPDFHVVSSEPIHEGWEKIDLVYPAVPSEAADAGWEMAGATQSRVNQFREAAEKLIGINISYSASYDAIHGEVSSFLRAAERAGRIEDVTKIKALLADYEPIAEGAAGIPDKAPNGPVQDFRKMNAFENVVDDIATGVNTYWYHARKWMANLFGRQN